MRKLWLLFNNDFLALNVSNSMFLWFFFLLFCVLPFCFSFLIKFLFFFNRKCFSVGGMNKYKLVFLGDVSCWLARFIYMPIYAANMRTYNMHQIVGVEILQRQSKRKTIDVPSYACIRPTILSANVYNVCISHEINIWIFCASSKSLCLCLCVASCRKDIHNHQIHVRHIRQQLSGMILRECQECPPWKRRCLWHLILFVGRPQLVSIS